MSQLEKKAHEIETLFHDREYSYRMAFVKVLVKKPIQAMDVGSFSLPEASEGVVLDLPRWVANILQSMGSVELQEVSIDSELFRAVTRERIHSNLQLNPIREDFFFFSSRRRHTRYQSAESDSNARQEYDRALVSTHDLITMRIVKILQLSALSSIPSDVFMKITPEERMLFETVRELVREWRRTLLND